MQLILWQNWNVELTVIVSSIMINILNPYFIVAVHIVYNVTIILTNVMLCTIIVIPTLSSKNFNGKTSMSSGGYRQQDKSRN